MNGSRLCFAFCLFAGLLAPAQAAERPNVVVILADDQGWGDLSVHGNTNLATPHIDSLARDGALFDRFFVCPVCSPTRAEFLTGRYHPRGGVWSTSTGGERLDLDEQTIGDTFRKAGYATAAFGKWHNGTQCPYHPNARGFDEYYGFCSGHWGDYFNPVLEHNGQTVRGKGFIIDDLTDHALAFIEEHRRAAVLLLPAVQHAALADAGARSVLQKVSRRRARKAPRRHAGRRPGNDPRPLWPCARTSTGTWAACWPGSTN